MNSTTTYTDTTADYEILVDHDIHRLTRTVKAHLKRGWVPIGGVTLTPGDEYMQAMVKGTTVAETKYA